MPRAPPHSHGHDTPLPPCYCGRQPHRRHHRRGHPPPCRGPTAIGPRRRNSPHPRDPHQPPMLHHRFPTAKPDRRRRTAAGLVADRPQLSPRPSLRVVITVPFPPLSGVRTHAAAPFSPPSPARLGQVGRKRARPLALVPSGPKFPPPGPVGWKILSLFLFPFLFPIFSYIFRC
jgi:hypothetical protein